MSDSNSNSILRTEGLTRKFGALVAVNDVSIDVPRGQVRAIIGPNGAGKTTLLDLIINKTHPTSGTVWFNGEDISSKSTPAIANRGLCKCFQISQVFGNLDVFENVRIPLINRHKSVMNVLPRGENYLKDEVLHMLSYVGMEDKLHEVANNLSYGDKKRLEVAMTLAMRPSLIFLDEPTAGVARAEGYEFMKLIRNLVENENMTIVFIEHDMDIVWNYADEISVMSLGSLIATGTPVEIKNNEFVQKAYLGGDEL